MSMTEILNKYTAGQTTLEETNAALEKDNAELRDALDALLTGVTA